MSEFLTMEFPPPEYLRQLVEQEADRFNGFNLMVGDARQLLYFSNREGHQRTLKPGIYGLSNHLLDSPWPKVTSGKTALGALVQRGGPGLTAGLFALLSDRSQPAEELLPDTGISKEWEWLLSAAFISSEEYGTRSSTVVLIGRDGRVVFTEQSFGPGGKSGEQVRFEFVIG